MQPRTRAIWILLFLGCGFTLISFNLIQIQLVKHEFFLRKAVANHTHPEVIPAKRGAIYDADHLLLAQTQRVFDLRLDGASPKAKASLPAIAAVVQIPVESIPYKPTNRYALIKHDVEDTVVAALQAKKLDCVFAIPQDKRCYPNNELAAHVLGFTDDNGHGLAGMEKQMDETLRGTPGERLIERDARKREIAAYLLHETPAIDGNDVTLTIKMGIQHIVEDQLDEIVATYSPDAAYIIVMDPQTGEIMAMGSRPNFDPNKREQLDSIHTRMRCVTDPVEPGSIFKIITLAGALNEGKIRLDTPVNCENGAFFYAGKELHDDEPHAVLPVREVMAQSSNIGFVKIAIDYLQKDLLWKYADAFGIGQATHLFTNQGESRGDLDKPNDWKPIAIARIPMGQGVSATPLQLTLAMSVIANGGRLMAPMLTKQITDPDGNVVQNFQPRIVRQVISAKTAREVTEALHQVTIDGTAKSVKITDANGEGWSYVGKTGTAQKVVNGEYSHTQHVSSFIGFMPPEDPAFVALVMVDNPKTKPNGDYGATVSAPVFAVIGKQIMQMMNIPPDIPAPPVILSSATSH